VTSTVPGGPAGVLLTVFALPPLLPHAVSASAATAMIAAPASSVRVDLSVFMIHLSWR
jgi:hypothetical protein